MQFVKVHPIDLQQNTNADILQSSVSKRVYKTTSIKSLQDHLIEDQSDSHSICSGTTDFCDDYFEVFLKKLKKFSYLAALNVRCNLQFYIFYSSFSMLFIKIRNMQMNLIDHQEPCIQLQNNNQKQQSQRQNHLNF